MPEGVEERARWKRYEGGRSPKGAGLASTFTSAFGSVLENMIAIQSYVLLRF
jgi:hypothetical protein